MGRTIPLPLETQPPDSLTPETVNQNFLFVIDNVTHNNESIELVEPLGTIVL
ncbi:hypothetical protein [Granulicella sp. S156]|uniref:hypothetical protein n=1 Tax=Granulicella sp. S156 TaxID=1747224 RepID=UPI00131D1817|nr:hypothetical protein [Granulicella sp. S156]